MRAVLAVAFTIIVTLLLPSSALAFTPRAGETVRVSTPVRDDLYAAGGTVDVTALIDGDLVAAGGTLTLAGPVTGGVLAAGGTVRLEGPVGRNVRAAAGALTLTAPVGTDAVLAGGSVMVERNARIARDLVASGGKVEVLGSVARNAFLNGGNVVIGGLVSGDVDVDADRLTVLSGARITGRLRYTTARPAEIQSGARIQGGTQQVGTRAARVHPLRPVTFRFGGRILEALWLFVLGGIALAVFPRGTRRVTEYIGARIWLSLLAGFLILVAVPVAIVLVMVTIVGIPLGLVALLLYFATLYPAQVFSALWLGTTLLGRSRQPASSPYLGLLLGTIILAVLVGLPFIGWLFRLVALLLGFGALWSVIWAGRAPPQARAAQV